MIEVNGYKYGTTFGVITQHISNIREVFNPSIVELAYIFDVSRQTVYKWLDGTNPEVDKNEQIKNLSHVADKFKTANISRAGLLIKMKAFNGQSLIDLFKTGTYTDNHIDILIKEAKIMEESHSKVLNSLYRVSPTDDWKSYVSIPASFDIHKTAKKEC